MTETLGWGDVDVDAAPRRRRLPVIVVWIAVGAALAAVGIWPSVRSSFADDAARWLDRQWLVGAQLETSRSDIESASSQQVATGDLPTLVSIVQDLDREEAERLTHLAASVAHHRTWSSRSATAARAVRAAFLAQARDLRSDVEAASGDLATSYFVESPFSGSTQELVAQASAQVQRLLAARHLAPVKPPKAALTSAAGPIAALHRVTTSPVGMRLALMQGAELDVWDLRTGKARLDVAGRLPINPPTGVLQAVGSSLLAHFDATWQLWPTDGSRPIDLPSTPNGFYMPDHAGGLWRTEEEKVRHYNANGRPNGPWRTYPHAMEPATAATENALVTLLGPVDFNRPDPVLWFPDTGRIVHIADPCPTAFEAARTAVAIVSCDQRSIDVVDASNRRQRTLRLPDGLAASGFEPVLSPDGSRLAVAGQQVTNDEATRTAVIVFDLTSGRVTRIPTTAGPVTWSADGSVLLLDVNAEDPALPTTTTETSNAPLAYWQPGMTRPAGIRIPLVDGSFAVAALP